MGEKKYDNRRSSTYKKNASLISLTYADGATYNGFVSQDTLHFGDLQVAGQDFAEIMRTTSGPESEPFEGVLGLGREGQSVNNIVPPMYNIRNNKLVEKNVFTLYFGNYLKNQEMNGMLSIGSINQSLYSGKIAYLPVNNKISFLHSSQNQSE